MDKQTDESPNLTKADAASYFGVSPSTIDRWISEGKLNGWVTPGGRIRFTKAQLRAAVRDGK